MPDKSVERGQLPRNPFTPDFGKVPVYFAGREDILDEIIPALDDQTNLCALFVGARGTGKTALLTYLSNEAEQRGWVSANVSSLPGMLEDIVQRTKESASHLISSDGGRVVSGLSVAGIGGMQWTKSHEDELNWRSRMNRLLDELNDSDIGLLITVDEIDTSLDEMVQLVTTYQHFVREGKKVGLLMAGLPYNIALLLSGKSTSFLRRAQKFDLGPLPDYEVEEAFRLTVENGGRFIESSALDEAVRIINGFPFLFQLLGSRAWKANIDSPSIVIADIKNASKLAGKEMEARIYEVTYSDLSKADRDFLVAMLQDEVETTRTDLMERLNKSSGHISTYKKRLMQAGVIGETLDGALRFTLPGFKDYLKELTS